MDSDNARLLKRGVRRPASRSRRRSSLALELIVALGLTAALAGMLVAATSEYAAVRREYDLRRVLRVVAAAELDRVRAGIASAGELGCAVAGPDNVQVTLTITAGEGVWCGLQRVHVVASALGSRARTIQVELVGYVVAGGTPR